ncbi:hypothetical protein E2C01_048856 [Portunus trituberculatus]|uniref:Potassium channel domain-containing protein n=1 Tax=Portunus trituberculatus TaxID=210409 RepID=A0A5B7GCA7_PORTR|nr:hypothetical protein [Portunus trituberculatus]
MRKTCPGSYAVLDPCVHLATTFAAYSILLLAWAIVRLCRVQPLRPQRTFHWIIAALTPVAAILFLLKIHAKDIGLRTCTLSSAFHVTVLVVDIVFFLRFLVEFLEGHPPEPLPSLTDCWLLVNTVWELASGLVVSEYQFLVLVRFLYPQTLEMYAALLTLLLGVRGKKRSFQLGVALVGVFVFAGAVQTAEEWSQLLGIHPGAEGEATTWHSYWDYIYMGYVTVSTVGYGDITPSTVASQIIVVVAIVVYINCYAGNCEELYHAMKGVIFGVTNHIPPLPRRRRVMVVGCFLQDTMQQLLDELCAQEETQIIVGAGEEKLSIRQDQKISVIRGDLNRSFFRRCFPEVDSDANNPAYILVAVNQEGDRDKEQGRDSDLHVLSLVQMVKADLPDLPVVAQVWCRETRVAMQSMEAWRTDTDQVVCHQEVMAGLVTQAVAAEGAASILATLLTSPPTAISPATHVCTDQLTRAHLWGQGLVLALSDPESGPLEAFEQVALQHYLLDRVLLLGCVQQSKTAAQDRFNILPAFLPPNARRVMLVPPDLVSSDGSVSTQATKRSRNITQVSPDTRSPRIRPTKTVWVVRDGPEGGVAKSAWERNLRVVTEENEQIHIDAAVLLEPQHDASQALYNYYSAKAFLAETSPWASLVANVEHGMRPGVWQVSAGSPHACTTFINSCVVTSATSLACDSDSLLSVWTSLVQECEAVEVEVKSYSCYGKMFQLLLARHRLLAMGATVQVSSHSRTACASALSLDHGEDTLAVTNPDFDFCLHPGDKMVAFRLQEPLEAIDA